MEIRPIRTDEDHTNALREIERLWGAKPGTDDGDRLDVLITLVDAYEERRWPVAAPDPVEAIRGSMTFEGRTQSDLAALLGSPSRASEVLKRKRPLTLSMIRRLNAEWHVPAELLVQPYELAS